MLAPGELAQRLPCLDRDFAVGLRREAQDYLAGVDVGLDLRQALVVGAVEPPEVKTGDIYRGIIPFVAMQVLALVLCFAFPGIATWLPRAIGW